MEEKMYLKNWFRKSHKHIGIIIIVIGLLFLYIKLKPNQYSKIESSLNDINRSYKDIHNNLSEISTTLKVLAKNDSIMSDALNHYPNAQPLPVSSITRVSSTYSQRIDPITGERKFHTGIDYVAKKNTNVLATADGIVRIAGVDNGYGKMIRIDHLNGYESDYAHLNSVLVRPNQKVKRGELIGTVGSTGKSTGNHLHYQITFNSKYINPRVFYTN